MLQLRKGCGDDDCSVATCFTCRLRTSGQRPVRRYSPTSARILAVYLAGTDNPYNGLCCRLQKPVQSAKSCTSNLGACRHLTPPAESTLARATTDYVVETTGSIPIASKSGAPASLTADQSLHHHGPGPTQLVSGFDTKLSDQPAKRDPRSFTAAAFETIALRLLHWLSPPGIRMLTDTIYASTSPQGRDSRRSLPGIAAGSGETSKASHTDMTSPQSASECGFSTSTSSAPTSTGFFEIGLRRRHHDQAVGICRLHVAACPGCPPTERRRSTGSSYSELQNSTMISFFKRADQGPISVDKAKLGLSASVPASTMMTSANSLREVSADGKAFGTGFDNAYAGAKSHRPSAMCRHHSTLRDDSQTTRGAARVSRAKHQDKLGADALCDHLPQTLRCLTPSIIELICDIYTEDGYANPSCFSTEARIPGPLQRESPKMKRATSRLRGDLRGRWKAFNDQVVFSVLSDPAALLSSFTRQGKLMDSQTIWYCLVRLTRTTPNLVFHSLWLASECLVVAPVKANEPQMPTAAPKPTGTAQLSDHDLGCIMSICLHALVAAVPIAPDSRTLYELSRSRAAGQTLPTTTGSSLTKHDNKLYLEYDDVFTNELALRLARRLFLAIPARQSYRRFRQPLQKSMDESNDHGILKLLFAQLDFLNSDTCTPLHFTGADRLLHETRVPTLLLDWARTVLMDSWNGKPTYSSKSSFGGAMAFMTAMREYPCTAES